MTAGDFATFAAALQDRAGIVDPWFAGEPRFAATPLWLSPARYGELAAAAEAVAMVHQEVATLVAADERLLDAFFAPPPAMRAMWQVAAPRWHGIARADVFATSGGLRVCELNSDTPSGQAEAVALGALATAAHPDGRDPLAGLGARYIAMVEATARAMGKRGALRIGIVYPTEITEDLALVALLQRWFTAAGHATTLGSPLNLDRAADGRASLLGEPCDVLVRHYKTDWWCERLPMRDDEPEVPDPAPLWQPLLHALAAELDGHTAIVNPFGAVVTQNKRALALCWEAIDRFSPAAQRAIRDYLPPTQRLELAREHIWHQRHDWVLKSDYGCEGDGVVIGAAVDQATWEDALAHALPQRWVAQRYFAALPESDGAITNHGVYVVAGRAAGIFARRHAPVGPGHDGITDASARCVPVLLREDRP